MLRLAWLLIACSCYLLGNAKPNVKVGKKIKSSPIQGAQNVLPIIQQNKLEDPKLSKASNTGSKLNISIPSSKGVAPKSSRVIPEKKINSKPISNQLPLPAAPKKIPVQPEGLLPVQPKRDSSLIFGLGKIAFSLLPLSPESQGRRKTIQTEIVKDKLWTFDQLQGVINVNVPVRCTVIKLKDGLFVHNPVGPTREFINMIRMLEKQHGNVKYIVLATLGVEHKGTAGAFSGSFPEATVYIQPGQYSVPINLPPSFFFPLSKTLQNKLKDIPLKSSESPWGDEIDHLMLGPLLPPAVGGFAETAFFHKETNTLLVTDAVVRVPDEPPAIIQEDARALIYHARKNMTDFVYDTPENRRKGWRRMVLFGLTFQPSGIKIFDTGDAIKMLNKVPTEMKALGRGTIPINEGLYPWEWVDDDLPSFKALQGGLLVAPILQLLIFNREPTTVLNWADKVSRWPIKRIIPCHLENNIAATGKDFRRAFNFLEVPKKSFPFGSIDPPAPRALEKDAKLLSEASVALTNQKQIFPAAELVRR